MPNKILRFFCLALPMTLTFLSSAFYVVGQTQSTKTEKLPFSEPPTLELLFSDNFEKDSRAE